MNYCQNMYNSLEKKDKIEELEEENANLKDFHNIESERLNKNIMLLKEENDRLREVLTKIASEQYGRPTEMMLIARKALEKSE